MAEAQQRNLSRPEATAGPAGNATNNEKNFMKRLVNTVRILLVFLVGIGIGMLSLSVVAKEFSSPTSLKPATLATTTDQFLVINDNGSPIIKTHVQATNYVKPAIPTPRRMNSTYCCLLYCIHTSCYIHDNCYCCLHDNSPTHSFLDQNHHSRPVPCLVHVQQQRQPTSPRRPTLSWRTKFPSRQRPPPFSRRIPPRRIPSRNRPRKHPTHASVHR